MNSKDYWEDVYSSGPVERLGWYEPRLETSLAWIRGLGLRPDAPIIDVGGGASTLVDDLLDAGYQSVTVLDASEKALAITRERLADDADLVTWLNGDITLIDLSTDGYEVWHDRAVFHFLTEQEQQRRYRENLGNALRPGGHMIIGTFAPEAPPTCSGLPVQQYSPEQLHEVLGKDFALKQHRKELHVTPGGVEQMYVYCLFRQTRAHSS